MGARSGGRTRPPAGRTGGTSTTISTVPTDAPSPSGPAWKPDTQTTSPSPAVDCRQGLESTSQPVRRRTWPLFGPAVESLLALLQWTARQCFSDGNHKQVNAHDQTTREVGLRLLAATLAEVPAFLPCQAARPNHDHDVRAVMNQRDGFARRVAEGHDSQ